MIVYCVRRRYLKSRSLRLTGFLFDSLDKAKRKARELQKFECSDDLLFEVCELEVK